VIAEFLLGLAATHAACRSSDGASTLRPMRRRYPLAPRFYPSSHLYPRAPQNVLSVGEIRGWLALLHKQFGWPWETLARTLGIGEGKHVTSKVRGNSWFVGGEQARCSRQLLRIISGELVLSQPNKFGRRDAVIADYPVPIRNPSRMAYDMKTGRLMLSSIPLPQPTLPSFTSALAKFLDRPDVDSDP
jgi:hypothetical protein